jgi:hypothetical protein
MVIYYRVKSVQENVHNVLRSQLKVLEEQLHIQLDWSNEIITTEEIKGNSKCEDRLLVIMRVNEKI